MQKILYGGRWWLPPSLGHGELCESKVARATYHWKDLNEGYNFALDLIEIAGLHVKLCASKVTGVRVVKILGLPFGNPRTKNHLDVAPVESYGVYYKGEGGGFPKW
jgi:hypothetical protein